MQYALHIGRHIGITRDKKLCFGSSSSGFFEENKNNFLEVCSPFIYIFLKRKIVNQRFVL